MIPTNAQRRKARAIFDAALTESKADTEAAMVLSAEDYIIAAIAKVVADRDLWKKRVDDVMDEDDDNWNDDDDEED